MSSLPSVGAKIIPPRIDRGGAPLRQVRAGGARSTRPNPRSPAAGKCAWSDTTGCRRDRAASANPARMPPKEPSPCPSLRRDALLRCRPRRQGRASPGPRRCRRNLRIARPSRNIPCCSNSAACAGLTSFCKLTKSIPGTLKQRGEAFERDRTMAVVAKIGIAGPAHPDTRPSVVRQARLPGSDAVRIRPQIGNVRRHCFELGTKYQRQAHQRTIQIELGQRIAVRHHERNARARLPPAL